MTLVVCPGSGVFKLFAGNVPFRAIKGIYRKKDFFEAFSPTYSGVSCICLLAMHTLICHFFSSSWCRGLATASACGSSWTFKCLFVCLPFFKRFLCNNNDQTCFSDTLTSAGPLSGSGINTSLGAQQMLMHRKSCLIPTFQNGSFFQ